MIKINNQNWRSSYARKRKGYRYLHSRVNRKVMDKIFWFDSKVWRGANLKIWCTRFENRKIRGLLANSILRSNQAGKLSVTWEARLGDSKLVFRFFENLYIKKQSRLSEQSATSGVPAVGRVAQWHSLSKTQHFWVALALIAGINLLSGEFSKIL